MEDVKEAPAPADAGPGSVGVQDAADAPRDNPSEGKPEDKPEQDLAAEVAAVKSERDQLAAEKADIWDRLLRRQAEFDNFRRRAEREKGEIWEKASMETIRAILPVLDDFERALKMEGASAEYARGMELISQRLIEALTRMGLEPIVSKDAKFDPNIHQALDTLASADHEEDTILEEYQKGYNFKGKLLRVALVRVSTRPS